MNSFDWERIIPWWAFPVLAVWLGLLFGSFANVCIFRLPQHRSVVRPRSHCQSCGEMVRALDNIPVLSWLLLRGRCRGCSARISARYPAVEALTGVLFLALALRFGPGPGFAVMAAFALAMVILFFTDLETMLLPDAITLPGTLAGVILSPWNPMLAGTPGQRLVASLAGAALGAGLIFAIMQAWRLWASRRFGPDASEEEKAGMGLGDLKMLALIGAFVGMGQVFFVTFAAATLGSVVGLTLMAVQGRERSAVLPFGTFLALASVAAIFFGRPAVRWYVGLLGLA